MADADRVITLSGDIDVAVVEGLTELLFGAIDASPVGTRVMVDCAEVLFIDSSGLRMMVRVQHFADEHDRRVTWSGLREHIRKLLQLTALDATIELEEGPPEIVEAARRELKYPADETDEG